MFDTLDTSGANPPLLTDGLIPVTHNGTTWVVADSKNRNKNYKWYDYDSKMWANAVLVNDTLRNSLTKDSEGNYTPGQTIGDTEAEGVLAFYVWIPRYKYKVWNVKKQMATDSYGAGTKGIDIVFERLTSTTGEIICEDYDFSVTDYSLSETCVGINGEYYTHPAFTFGDDELTGLWVGKFEISSTNQTASSYGGGNSTTLMPRVLPNVLSWIYNYVTNYHIVIYNMQNTSNEYGLTTDRTVADSHMLNTLEWGVTAYLTHSKYGRCANNSCTEVSINNSGNTSNYTTYTGRSGGAPGYSQNTVKVQYPDNSTATVKYHTYGYYTYDGKIVNYDGTIGSYASDKTLGTSASSTGNIYGIYDLSGGAEEHLMGNMSTSAGKTAGTYEYYASDGGSKFTYSEDTAKYIVTYAYDSTNYTNQLGYNRARLGDVAGEVAGNWYDDFDYFTRSDYAWFANGGYFDSGKTAGIFYFRATTGFQYTNTARSALAVFPKLYND